MQEKMPCAQLGIRYLQKFMNKQMCLEREEMSKKEVLIVGPNFYGYNESVAKAFQVKGFKTNIINFEEENIPVTGNKLIDKFLLKARREYYVNDAGNQIEF